MQTYSAAVLFSVLAMSIFSTPAKAVEDFEPKPTKKPTKFFKADQFHHKPGFPLSETNLDDLENPFVPPPVPRDGQDVSPWSWFMNPSSKGFVPPGEVSKSDEELKPDDKKENKDTETEASRAQRSFDLFFSNSRTPLIRTPDLGLSEKAPFDKESQNPRFIGPSAIDPFFYSNPLSPPSLPSPPRRPGGYGFYPHELFMVVLPRQCTNGTESNSTDEDVAVKFFSNSASPDPPRCTFAIASCCAPFNYHIRFNCFEMLGCYGAFWDMNPCAESVVTTAVKELANFYKSAPDNSTTPAPASTEAPATPAAT